MWRDGNDRPSAANAERTRSRDSPTALSGRPTTAKAGSPAVIVTWVSTSTTSTPLNATVRTRATMFGPVPWLCLPLARKFTGVCRAMPAERKRQRRRASAEQVFAMRGDQPGAARDLGVDGRGRPYLQRKVVGRGGLPDRRLGGDLGHHRLDRRGGFLAQGTLGKHRDGAGDRALRIA